SSDLFQILSVLAQPGFHRRQGLYGSCRYQDIKRGGHRTDGYVENANRGNTKAMECRNERLLKECVGEFLLTAGLHVILAQLVIFAFVGAGCLDRKSVV